jgi:hypothetical protein
VRLQCPWIKISILILSFFGRAHGAGVPGTCLEPCEVYAQLVLPPQGAARLVGIMAETQEDDILSEIKAYRPENLTFKARPNCKGGVLSLSEWESSLDRCLTLPEYDPKRGYNFKKDNSQTIPIEGSFENIRISDVAYEVIPGENCESEECPVTVKINKLTLDGELNLNARDTDRVFTEKAPIRLSSVPGKPVATISTVLSPSNKDGLQTTRAVDPKSTKVQITTANFKVSVPNPPLTQSLLGSIKVHQRNALSNHLKDPTWAKRAWDSALFHEVSGLAHRNPNTSRSELEKKALENLRSVGITIEKLEELTAQDFVDNNNYSHLQNRIPEIGRILDEARTLAYAEKSGFKDPILFSAVRVGEDAINQTIHEALSTKAMEKEIKLISQKLSSKIANDINLATRGWVKNLSEMTLFPEINLNDLKEQADLVKQHESLLKRAAQGENIDEARRNLSQKFRALHARMGQKWHAMDVGIVLQTIEQGSKAVKLVAFNKATPCSGPSPTIKESREQKTQPTQAFDLGVQVTVPGINKYFEDLQKRGSLNLCLGDDHRLDCKDGTNVKLTEPPLVSWQPPDYVIRFKNQVGAFGGINTEVRAQVKTCNGVPCLEMKNVNSKAQSAFLLLAGAGYTMENMINETIPAGESALPVDFGYAKLKEVLVDQTGTVGMYYDLIHDRGQKAGKNPAR